MVGTVQVRWCPRCRSWGKAKRITIDPAQAFVAGFECAPEPFDYVREDYRCGSCFEDFSSTRITRCKPDHIWSARNVLAKLCTLEERTRRNRAIPLSWDWHPELADFSAVVPPLPTLGT